MPINQKFLLQAFYDALFDSQTLAPPGVGDGRPALQRSRTHLAMMWPGLAIDKAQFANQWSPENPTGSMAAAENFSTLVDPAPLLAPVYTPGGGVDELYGEIVNANVRPAPPDPAGQEAFEKAWKVLTVDGIDYDDTGKQITVPVDSPLFRNYKNKRARYVAALTSYTSAYLQHDLTKPEDQRKWAIIGPLLRDPVDQAYNDLQTARPGVVESALATVDQYQQSSLAEIFASARRVYTETRKSSLVDPASDWHLCQPFPANWMADAAADQYATVTINSSSMRLNSDSRFASWAAGGGIDFGLWRVGAAGSTTTQQYDLSAETKDLTLSFKLGRVEIRRRSWHRSSLTSLHGWSTAGRAPGDYSTGRADVNPGVFPLLPTALLVVSEFKASAKWGTSDLHRAAQATTLGADVSFLTFNLSGSHRSGSSSSRYRSTFDGTTVSAPGPMIVGVMSTVQPFTPPTDGPPSVLDAAQLSEAAPRGDGNGQVDHIGEFVSAQG
ncbi:hypothetical protein ACWEIJ_36295 [Lentzea sp. NPDC004789]